MKLVAAVFVLTLLCVTAGCSSHPTEAGQPPPKSTKHVTEIPLKPPVQRFNPADLDERGRLILYVIGNTPFRLNDEVGVMLINDGNEGTPKARYVLGVKSRQTLLTTRDEKTMFTALKALPPHSRIRWYDSCSTPRSYGLPPRIRTNLERKITALGHHLEEDYDITCYCESFEKFR